MTTFEASLALLSAIVGGGIVGVPFSLLHCGIPLGVFLNFAFAVLAYFASVLYLKSKDMVPVHVESLYELGFVSAGVASIYFISITMMIAGFGVMMIYFIIFGDISGSIAAAILKDQNFFTTRFFYVAILSTSMIPLVLKKKLHEMKAVAALLFVAIGLFVGLFIYQLMAIGNMENHDESYAQYYDIEFDFSVITSINIITVAYSFQLNLFPTFNSLQNKTNKTALDFVSLALIMTFFVYVSLGILSVYMFGEALKKSVLDNVDEEADTSSYVIRIAFLIVLACHIPYAFFPVKEALLIVVDEIQNKSMTKAIQYKI